MPEKFASTDDRRVVNNVMRHNYRTLSEEEKLRMAQLKDMGLAFIELLHEIGGTIGTFHQVPNAEIRQSSRELSVAQTKIEEAVMWAVKHLTR